jgi:hypothetical protein
MPEADNKATIRRLVAEGFNGHNLDAIDELSTLRLAPVDPEIVADTGIKAIAESRCSLRELHPGAPSTTPRRRTAELPPGKPPLHMT